MARERTRAAKSKDNLPNGEDDPGRRTQDQRGHTGRMVADPPGLEEGSKSAIDDAIRSGERDTEDDREGLDDSSPVQRGESLEDLQRDLRRERQRADAADARASDLESRTADALDSASTANLNTLKTAKDRLVGEQTSLKSRLSQAHADGDFDAVAEINQQMTTAAVQLSNIENGIIALEQQPKQREALARRGESTDVLYHQITKGMAPVAKQWFRDNPEYYQDKTKLNRVVSAVGLVMNSDDPPEENSHEYFERVEAELGRFDPKFADDGVSRRSGDDDRGQNQRGRNMRRQNNVDDEDEPLSGASGGRRREVERPSGGAPVARNGRGTGGANNGNGREIRATAAEIEAAEIANIPLEDYMRNKRELIREDRIGPGARNRNQQMH